MTLLLPVLFFVILEGGLRLAGYGADYPLFEEVEQHPEFKVPSRSVGQRYFHHLQDAPTGLHDVFHAQKPEGELRLFVQGGSTAAGFPFYHGAAFSRMLKWRLQDAVPHRPIEVVNTAMAAVNSYTLLDLADEIIREQPDAVLIYAGHNEYYGAFGVGSTESFGTSRALVNAYLRLRHWRTVQLLRNSLSRLAAATAGRSGSLPQGSMMARMVREQSIPYGSGDYERGLRQFEGNLTDLLSKYRRAGIPVFVATLVANESDHPPFSSVYQPDSDPSSYEARVEEGHRALQAGDASRAIGIFRELTEADSLAASGFFGLGRALQASGDFVAALAAFRTASDRDVLRFRAPSAFNSLIREIAAEQGATVVDVEARFRREAPGGIVGQDLMLEHLHPTVDGYFLISDAFYDAITSSPLLRDNDVRSVPPAVARGRVRLTPADSLVGVIRLTHLLAGWPFQPLGSPPVRTEDIVDSDSPEGRMALKLYRGQANWLEATEELASDLERAGRISEAIRAREAMIMSYPMLAEPHLGIAGLYTRHRDLDRAIAHYNAAIARGERSGNAHGLLGAIVLERGMRAASANDPSTARAEFERARTLLEASRRLNPRNPQTLYNLSGAYAQLGLFDEARRSAQAVLQLQPAHSGARQLLTSLPED